MRTFLILFVLATAPVANAQSRAGYHKFPGELARLGHAEHHHHPHINQLSDSHAWRHRF